MSKHPTPNRPGDSRPPNKPGSPGKSSGSKPARFTRDEYVRAVVAAAGPLTPDVAAELRQLLPPVPVLKAA